MPNPWDAGSGRLLESWGVPALATTSAGLTWSLGKLDRAVTRGCPHDPGRGRRDGALPAEVGAVLATAFGPGVGSPG